MFFSNFRIIMGSSNLRKADSLFQFRNESCTGRQEIKALHDSYLLVNKNVPATAAKGRIFISKAVIVLSLAKKNRDADHLQNFVYDQSKIDAARLAADLRHYATVAVDNIHVGYVFFVSELLYNQTVPIEHHGISELLSKRRAKDAAKRFCNH